MDSQITLTTGQLIALTAVMLLAFAASLGMAFNLDAIAVSFATTNTVAGLITSAEMMTIAVATLVFARFAGSIHPHRIYLLGLTGIVVFNLASVLAPDLMWLGTITLVAGVSVGAVSATVMRTAGRSHNPEFTFGIIMAMLGVMAILIAFVLPRAPQMRLVLPDIHAWSEVDGLYIVYALCAMGALSFISSTPGHHEAVPTGTQSTSRPPRSGWLALLGLGLLFYGHALLGVFLVKVGRDMGLGPETVGYVFMIAGIFMIPLPMVAGYVGVRFPSRGLIVTIACAVVAMGQIVAYTGSTTVFFVSAPIFMALPAAIIPIFLGAMARLDPLGGLAAAHQAFLMVGGALAAFTGGVLSDLGGYQLNGLGVAVFVVVGVVLAQPGLARADHLRHAPV